MRKNFVLCYKLVRSGYACAPMRLNRTHTWYHTQKRNAHMVSYICVLSHTNSKQMKMKRKRTRSSLAMQSVWYDNIAFVYISTQTFVNMCECCVCFPSTNAKKWKIRTKELLLSIRIQSPIRCACGVVRATQYDQHFKCYGEILIV